MGHTTGVPLPAEEDIRQDVARKRQPDDCLALGCGQPCAPQLNGDRGRKELEGPETFPPSRRSATTGKSASATSSANHSPRGPTPPIPHPEFQAQPGPGPISGARVGEHKGAAIQRGVDEEVHSLAATQQLLPQLEARDH